MWVRVWCVYLPPVTAFPLLLLGSEGRLVRNLQARPSAGVQVKRLALPPRDISLIIDVPWLRVRGHFRFPTLGPER